MLASCVRGTLNFAGCKPPARRAKTKKQTQDGMPQQCTKQATSNTTPRTSHIPTPISPHTHPNQISDSALQRVQLNPSITGHESHKQFAIGLTVEQISPVHRKVASAIEKQNQQKFNQKQNLFKERQEAAGSK